VELKVRCDAEVDMEFDLDFVIRSSPCAKEFIVDRRRYVEVTNLLVYSFFSLLEPHIFTRAL